MLNGEARRLAPTGGQASGETNPLQIKPLQKIRPIVVQRARLQKPPEILSFPEKPNPHPYLPAFNPSLASGEPNAPLTSAASSGGAGQSFETGAARRSRAQGRISESDW